jgi:hypothetical protein
VGQILSDADFVQKAIDQYADYYLLLEKKCLLLPDISVGTEEQGQREIDCQSTIDLLDFSMGQTFYSREDAG